ncbi:MAG: hypothetical protein QW059_06390 [Nitrososphaerota archaeon]
MPEWALKLLGWLFRRLGRRRPSRLIAPSDEDRVLAEGILKGVSGGDQVSRLEARLESLRRGVRELKEKLEDEGGGGI